MTVERFNLGRMNIVIVGIRFDGHAKELLDWALVKVAAPGDSVVAIHVCRHSGCISNEKALLDCYLKDYEELCNEKKVALSAEILKGDSFRKVLVEEAKKYSASAVIVGLTKHTALGGWASVAKYCAKKLPPTTEVMAICNGKPIFSGCSRQSEGHGKDREPSYHVPDKFTLRDALSEFGESEISEMSRFSFDARSVTMSSNDEILSPLQRHRKGSLSSISLPVEDFTKQRPGWPLLQTASLRTRPSNEARKMSVVQWVMSLPHRSSSEVSESNFLTSTTESSRERENEILAEMSSRNKMASEKKLQKELELIFMKNSACCKVFSHDVLKMSTTKFSSGNLIGKGGCNSVYKGILPEGKQVAVKILLSSKDSRTDFLREVDIMTTLKHRRITPLLGICIKDNQLISVYEFFPKGNLEENLHGNRKRNSVMSWEVRFRIALGIAEALNYIHNECSKPIIHRDVKSSNILLTHELEPQLCDFGLAIWGPTASSFVMDSDIVGTFGYLAPEYFMHGKVSDKIDVYAFGVVLLELLSGKKPIGFETTKGQECLVMWAKPKLENGDLEGLLDPNLDGDIDEAQMQRMALAAKLCLTRAARLRPKMDQVLSILKGKDYANGVLKTQYQDYHSSETQDDNDDEVYPDSSAESHLNLAFLDVNEHSASFSSPDQSSPLSVEDYLKKRWSRSSSLD